jgi:hypothetical protein
VFRAGTGAVDGRGAGALTAGWAILVLLAGLWGVYLAERYLAQLRLNALSSGSAQGLGMPVSLTILR